MLILVSGAKMQLPLQLGVTDKQTDSTTTVNPLRMRALRVNYLCSVWRHMSYVFGRKFFSSRHGTWCKSKLIGAVLEGGFKVVYMISDSAMKATQ